MIPRLFISICLLATLPLSAATLRVPTDFNEIETAMRSAEAGDTVLVAPGTYIEWTVPLVSGVTLLAEDMEHGATVIHASDQSFVIVAEYVDATALIRGFTLRNATSSGIFLDTSDPVIEDCLIIQNRGPEGGGALLWRSSAQFTRCRFSSNLADRGGAVYLRDIESQPIFTDCEFYWNTAWDLGGGIFVDRARPVFDNCVIFGNQSNGDGAGLYAENCLSGWPILDDCVLAKNHAFWRGGGAHFNYASGSLSGCTIVDNTASIHSGGLWFLRSNAIVENSIIAFNAPSEGVVCGPFATPRFQCCDFYGNEGGDEICGADLGGNFISHPQFCDLDNNDWTLAANSPCLPLASDCGLLIGARGLGCSLPVGVSEVSPGIQAQLSAFPNPFNPSTEIRISLPESGPLELSIFDIAGRRIRTLCSGTVLVAGEHSLRWKGRDNEDRPLPSGVYFLKLKAGGLEQSRKLILLK
ncbi:right-handed parallel beta-helix repeat-containing protein [bacterium]|nr:right-handed parallel beta-helix repeat-containing protein [bacterium]